MDDLALLIVVTTQVPLSESTCPGCLRFYIRWSFGGIQLNFVVSV